MNKTVELDKKYVADTYARFPVELVSGKGSLLYDNNGKEYIDLGTGIAVNTFGVADDEWASVVSAQANKLSHVSNLYYSEPCAVLAEKLCNRTGMKKVFFSNSGAEANECAIKTARKYAGDKKGADYYNIITLKNSFHGRTVTTLAATGQDVFHTMFNPLTDGFLYADANDIESVKSLVSCNKCAAIMFEVVQGEGGVMPLDHDFVKKLAELAAREDILLIADEVQIGNGRSGKLYGYMNYGITPDIITTAKGLAGGLPLGATLFGEKTANVLTNGTHGSTFGGNPICCAGAINIIDRIDNELLNGVAERSKIIFDTLANADGIKAISGMGLMLGIETEKDAGEVIAECMKNGVLVLKAKNKVRLLPALNIPIDLLKKALDVLKNACVKAERE